jgi:sugar lactone lactonase YvrE
MLKHNAHSPIFSHMSWKKLLLLMVAVLVAYLLVYPAPINPIANNFPRTDLPENNDLADIEIKFDRICAGCEDISIVGNQLYTGAKDGRLLRLPLMGDDRSQEIMRFNGRPLGLEVLGDSLAWVCVEHEGLARVDLRNNTYEIVVNSYNDTTFMLIDYLDVAASGNVYFSDASDQYGDDDLQYDVLQGRPNGALYRYEPATGQTIRLVDNLFFANGVVVDPAERFVLVAETSGFRVTRYWMAGPKAGTTDLFIEGLPGWPDGISRGDDGLVYVTLISPRTALHDFILPRPWTRRLVTKLPKFVLPQPVRQNRILAYTDAGVLVHNWADSNPEFSAISSVERVGDRLYLGTLDDQGIGVWMVK